MWVPSKLVFGISPMKGTIVDFKKKYSENTADERSTSSCLLCLSGVVGLFTECFRDKPYTDER